MKPYDSVRCDSYQKCALQPSYVDLFSFVNKVEGVGFEPTQPVRAADLQSAPINHSGTPPRRKSITRGLKNPAREGSRTHQPTDYKSVALPLSYSGDFKVQFRLNSIDKGGFSVNS
jgi:hypothetical protein